jgi:hypothetical protein
MGAVRLGAVGVALGWVLVYPLFVVWLATEALEELRLPWKTAWRQLRPIARALVLMMPFVVLVRSAWPGGELLDRIIRLGLASASGAIVYGAAIYLWGGGLPGELGEVSSWIVRRPAPRTREVPPLSALPLASGEQTL